MGFKMDHVEANVIFHKISQNEPIIQFYHLEELLGQYGTSDLFKRKIEFLLQEMTVGDTQQHKHASKRTIRRTASQIIRDHSANEKKKVRKVKGIRKRINNDKRGPDRRMPSIPEIQDSPRKRQPDRAKRRTPDPEELRRLEACPLSVEVSGAGRKFSGTYLLNKDVFKDTSSILHQKKPIYIKEGSSIDQSGNCLCIRYDHSVNRPIWILDRRIQTGNSGFAFILSKMNYPGQVDKPWQTIDSSTGHKRATQIKMTPNFGSDAGSAL